MLTYPMILLFSTSPFSQQNIASGSKKPLHPSSVPLFHFVFFFSLMFFYILFSKLKIKLTICCFLTFFFFFFTFKCFLCYFVFSFHQLTTYFVFCCLFVCLLGFLCVCVPFYGCFFFPSTFALLLLFE